MTQQVPMPPGVPRILHFIEGWNLIRRTHGRKDDEYRRRVLRNFVTLDEVDEALLAETEKMLQLPVSLDVLWANAVLTVWGEAEEIRLQMLPAVRAAAPGDGATAAGVLGPLNKRHGWAKRAETILRQDGSWVFDPVKRQVRAALIPGVKANSPKLLVTKMIEAAYRDYAAYAAESGGTAEVDKEIRRRIAHALNLFFVEGEITHKRIKNAIDNYRRLMSA